MVSCVESIFNALCIDPNTSELTGEEIGKRKKKRVRKRNRKNKYERGKAAILWLSTVALKFSIYKIIIEGETGLVISKPTVCVR